MENQEKMTGYELHRAWFNFAFDTPECKPLHTALYLWIVELNNRLGWKKRFTLPTDTSMEGLSIGNRGTYTATLDQIEAWGFIKVIQRGKNQYHPWIIELCLFNNEQTLEQALDKAMVKHSSDTVQSTGSIDKQVNKQTSKQTHAGKPADGSENRKSKKSDKFNPLEADLPYESAAFRQAWADWITHLREKKKSPTETSIKRQLIRCKTKESESVAIAEIYQAIEKGWHGLYDLKPENIPKQTGQAFKPATLNDQIKSKPYDPNAT